MVAVTVAEAYRRKTAVTRWAVRPLRVITVVVGAPGFGAHEAVFDERWFAFDVGCIGVVGFDVVVIEQCRVVAKDAVLLKVVFNGVEVVEGGVMPGEAVRDGVHGTTAVGARRRRERRLVCHIRWSRIPG